nr:hypothetical protein [Paraburkholderia kirstenboschensis]
MRRRTIGRPCADEHLAPRLGSDDSQEIVVENKILIVPSDDALRFDERIVKRHLPLSQQRVDDLVVEVQEDGVDLAHERIFIVARVTDQRPALYVAELFAAPFGIVGIPPQ